MESFRTADGRKLSYRRTGSGPVLVCHPGGPGFSSRYLHDLAGLGASFELVMLNPRGSEGSDRPADRRAYRTADYVSDLEELRGHLGLERMQLLGHSHGGVVAAAYAAAHPDRVDRLVLASTLARFAQEQQSAMEAGIEAKAGEPWYADARAALEDEQAGRFEDDAELGELALREFPFYFATYGEAEQAYLETLRGEVPVADALLLFNNEIMETFDLRPDLVRITAPTLVITGDLDFITGPVCAADFAAIPGGRTVVLPGCGHFIFVEARDRFRDELTAFLAG
ncbi:MAG TPA: alpha/beta hydrolase [Gaiellaceae bacterium]|nr:alpha/beta hydrolase [Gaiellaceae bacterium]